MQHHLFHGTDVFQFLQMTAEFFNNSDQNSVKKSNHFSINNLISGQYFNDKPIGVHEVSFANGTTAMAMGNRGINGLNWTILNQQEVQTNQVG